MPKSLAGALVAIVAITAIGGIYLASKSDNDKQANQTSDSVADSTNMNELATDQQPIQSSDQVLSGTVEMNIADFKYTMSDIKVKKGTIVKWTNQDSMKHDVTPNSESDDFMASDLLGKGQSYSVTFNTVGSYSYFCSPHPYMKGVVTVIE
jgi:amicyanin